MARAGRKRKSPATGRKKVNAPRQRKIEMTPEMFARRAKQVGAENVKIWDGTQIHAWHLRGLLDSEHVEAARKMESLTKQVKTALRTPREPGRRAQAQGSMDLEDDDGERFQALMKAYDEAVIAIGNAGLRRALTACMREEHANLNMVQLALENLRKHFGI